MNCFKKILTVLLSAVLICSLSGCALSDEQKTQKAENEKLATPILEEFCENNFSSYKIRDIQGYHYTSYGGIFPSEMLSDLVYADVSVKKETFKLYYDVSTEEFFTDYYNEVIKSEVKKSLLKIIPIEICKVNIEFSPVEYEGMGLSITKIKDTKLENILNEGYRIDVVGHYDNIDSEYFSEDKINVSRDSIVKYDSIVLVNVLNCTEYIEYHGDSAIKNCKDRLSYNQSEDNIVINNYDQIKCDDFTVIYDKNSISGIEVTSEENTDSAPNTTYYPDYTFVKTNRPKYAISIFSSSQETKEISCIYIQFNNLADDEYCNIVDDSDTRHDMIYCRHYNERCYYIPMRNNNQLQLTFWKCVDKKINN